MAPTRGNGLTQTRHAASTGDLDQRWRPRDRQQCDVASNTPGHPKDESPDARSQPLGTAGHQFDLGPAPPMVRVLDFHRAAIAGAVIRCAAWQRCLKPVHLQAVPRNDQQRAAPLFRGPRAAVPERKCEGAVKPEPPCPVFPEPERANLRVSPSRSTPRVATVRASLADRAIPTTDEQFGLRIPRDRPASCDRLRLRRMLERDRLDPSTFTGPAASLVDHVEGTLLPHHLLSRYHLPATLDVLSNRCQRMKPQPSQEYARASSPPSSAWSVEWPSRSVQVVLPHMGHFRDSSTTFLPMPQP